ncbi:hypothetical protein [Paraburkholderia terrae]|uniref:hypothetical protein n=1 Tax=Paraburkholderia terrae TaxID=311230 RepID=UPI001EE1ED95|nr:hypothetical protein [Paraburkholderia terrae]GJH04617.1 hypothetical protein CBA19C8_28690 [Paraburkholderia terrae]
MTNNSAFLPQAIDLPSGIAARIELIPMPKPDSTGAYPFNPPNTDIQVSLFRNDTLIERRSWDSLIGADRVTLKDGTTLDENDIYALDGSSWDVMGQFGMIPTVWAGN